MEFLIRVSLCLLTFMGKTFGDENGIKIYCKEDEDVILPCSFGETLKDKSFDWKKDETDVLLCDNGQIYPASQDEQFRGRVSHFPDELNSGNASIRIKKAMVSDSGTYTCLNINSVKSHEIELTVGTCPKPAISTHNKVEGGIRVECTVDGAYPKPKMELRNSTNGMVETKKPNISQNEMYFDVIVEAVVTKNGYYHCVVIQQEICHQMSSRQTMVHIPSGSSTAIAIGLGVLLAVALGINVGFFV